MEHEGFDQERIRKHFDGKANDLQYISRLFCNDEYIQELEHSLRLQWYEALDEKNIPERNLDHILYKLNYEINQKNSNNKSRFSVFISWFSKIAAILILPLLVYSSIHLFTQGSLKKSSWIEIKAPRWSKVEFCLPDGSKGWLNSNSCIKYSDNFNARREVRLTGEAFFNVEKNEGKPFRVNTGDVMVTVLGTKFNIESYKNENIVEVTLQEGSLNYYNIGMKKSYLMKPNDCISYNKESGEIKVDVVQPEKFSAWKDGKLVFRNDPLDVVAKRLGRWYNVDVEVLGDISNQPTLRATFFDESLEVVMKFLKLSLPIDYVIQEPEKSGDKYERTKVIITSKK